ncbi:DUF4326 domain-containing protein [Afifella sp. H1R]|uniref:DUF4326 domain-containing protein n=1 Tax=Afifella sp. H1R TaxID=2908841 RepID=UPI001F1B2F20|nr:DUF4326 domain-containing protein [Afifella sp. H1R]MCF1502933.1 DUF4326 domain-containing protein [Afifella sp. H1R]
MTGAISTGPRRIQRSRAKGWRMPAGAIYVGRPSRFGNPFPVSGPWISWAAIAAGFRGDAEGRRAAAVAFYEVWLARHSLAGEWADAHTAEGIVFATGVLRQVTGVLKTPAQERLEYPGGHEDILPDAVRRSAAEMMHLFDAPVLPARPGLAEIRERLSGRDLVCWCRLDQACHADVLLDIANSETTEREVGL